ncbi:hypothetical protein BKA64DRAFT_714564 [Cadophora sp. MPI-SDFR-AT-0126]|nr:hypothetical protein BKA64DRAFT_714564 [Leotiomycetes sp. MPI-SDFR-AT-0126]
MASKDSSTHRTVALGKAGRRVDRSNSPQTHRYLTRSKGTLQEIDAIEKALALFTFELPDPNEELSAQQCFVPKLTLFPKLPLELRLMVWKLALPRGRLIALRDELYKLFAGNNEGRPPLPISLHVNQESRRETLTYYELFHREEFLSTLVKGSGDRRRPQIRPVCFSPTRDYFHMWQTDDRWGMREFLRVRPDAINRISRLLVKLTSASNSSRLVEQVHETINKFEGLQVILLLQPENSKIKISAKGWEKTKVAFLKNVKEGRPVSDTIKLLPYQRLCKEIWSEN